MKLPDPLLAWLEKEAKHTRRPKSAIIRDILQKHQRTRPRSALDMAADLCGSVRSGVRDLSYNKKHLRGFGQ